MLNISVYVQQEQCIISSRTIKYLVSSLNSATEFRDKLKIADVAAICQSTFEEGQSDS